MPIKFACPQCKTAITVDEKMAGKSGKCKCGASVKVPSPKKAAANQPTPTEVPAPGGSLDAVFDDLTEADYNRQSPFQNVYNPERLKSTANATLNQFDSEDRHKKNPSKKKAVKKSSKWRIAVVVIVVLLVLGGIAAGIMFALGMFSA